MGGVTRSLNISYLKAIPLGTNLHEVPFSTSLNLTPLLLLISHFPFPTSPQHAQIAQTTQLTSRQKQEQRSISTAPSSKSAAPWLWSAAKWPVPTAKSHIVLVNIIKWMFLLYRLIWRLRLIGMGCGMIRVVRNYSVRYYCAVICTVGWKNCRGRWGRWG